MTTAAHIRTPADLTAEWLAGALGSGPIAAFTHERIGTGQMSENHRVALTYGEGAGGPESVVLKVAAADATSRQTGIALGLYEREVRFYSEVAPLLDGALAPCFHASFDSAGGTFCLLLGDAGPAVQGDEIAGTDLEHARLAMRELGRLHGPLLGSEDMERLGWLNRDSPISQPVIEQLLAGFLERYDERIAPQHRLVCQRLAASFDAFQDLAGTGPQGIVHGDYRLDNLLFGVAGADRPLTVVDWQTVTWGPSLTDVAYFLGCALTTADRRAWTDELLAIYHEALGPDAPVTLEECREGVRRTSFFGVMMAIVSPMLVVRTERGDDMFMTMIARHAQHVLDLDALAVLPEPVALEPLRPLPADEGVHEPGLEPLWNESWYFDVASPEQGIGAYVRLGLDPGQGRCWYTAVVCGPGRPTVTVADYAAPLPGPDLAVHGAGFEAGQACEEPLARYRVTLRGAGEAFEDPSAVLRGEPGTGAQVALDLVWETDGEPFQYRLATRYEIPCRVSGTLRVGGDEFTLDGALGQRDHSWGVRDWWSMEWVWSAGHLDDGTRVHGVDVRIPDVPPLGTGYVQAPATALVELQRPPAAETIRPDGLGADTLMTFGDLAVTFSPRGHGPLLLVADDGRVSEFPRAWCELSTPDGRRGVGWMEWNRNRGRSA